MTHTDPPVLALLLRRVQLIAVGEQQVINECVQAAGFGCHSPHHAIPLTSAESATPPPVLLGEAVDDAERP